MSLCSSGYAQYSFGNSLQSVKHSAPLHQHALAKLSRHTAGSGHLIHAHRSSTAWKRGRRRSLGMPLAWNRDPTHTDDASSSNNDTQASNGSADEHVSSSAVGAPASESTDIPESTEHSTSFQSSPAAPARSAHEQIGERYPVLGAALETKDAVGASRESPEAVLQAFGTHARELFGIGFSSLAWTGDAVMQLLTKPILPRSAHIAELKKAVQADPTNAEK